MDHDRTLKADSCIGRYKDGTKMEMKVCDKSMRTLAKRFRLKPEKWMLRIFELAKLAMGITRGKLVMIDTKKFQKAQEKLKSKSMITDIISLGCHEEDDICYVFKSDRGKARTEATIIHEALHLCFGGHPWPHEKEES